MIEAKGTRLLREKRVGRPAGASRGLTAYGKRVPEAKINMQFVRRQNQLVTGFVQTDKFTYTGDRPFSYHNLQIAN
ncbi:hypothetical protein KEH51_02300 [[Brevibacterium] frigoritolerans]|uniref:Uncharacterized protein n=1 Tax=Peribacillus frigoritolerans TaxID=450367 RepID=A0A941FM26_9BACI|nr:hypothetical protein [Peribacillus frigoritolerans]